MTGSNNVISSTRLTSDADGHTAYTTSVLSSVDVYIQRMRLERAAMLSEGNPYGIYEMVGEGLLDVEENDEITDKGSVKYRITAVDKVDDITQFTHCIMVRKV